MIRLNKTYVLFSLFIVFLLFINIAYSAEQVSVEFLYWDPRKDPGYCDVCPIWQEEFERFWENNQTVNRVQVNYSGRVLFRRIEFDSPEGQNESARYNIIAPNSLIIKGGGSKNTTIIGDFNETSVRQIIDAYLAGLEPPSSASTPLVAVLGGAFLLGLVGTLSPCLILMLSFVLGYTLGKTTPSKEGFMQVTIFGIGFVCAALLLGLGTALMFFSMAAFQNILVLIVCILAILFGLNLLGFNIAKLLRIEAKSYFMVAFFDLFQKMNKKRVSKYAGLTALGFIFYFLNPCITAIFIALLNTVPGTVFFTFLPLILLAFCSGVIIPFIGIGILAGSISKLATSANRYKSKIRAVSGLILIGYALYIIVSSFILPKLL